jgi:hypothetical protein
VFCRTAMNLTTCSHQVRHLLLDRRVTFDRRISSIPWSRDTATEYNYSIPALASRLGGSTATPPGLEVVGWPLSLRPL